MSAPLVTSSDDEVKVVRPTIGSRVMTFIRYLPCGDTLASSVTDSVAFLDKRIPSIRGRPAISELIANLKPGITVSLVSLPLSISLAIAADASPVQGIITAAWAGLVSAFLGGSHYNVVGPTGALSGILSQFSVRYGASIQPLLAILAGLIAAVVYLTRLERYFVFIPGAVMHGFTLGVAFIIAFNQINFALGLPKLPRHETFVDNLVESLKNSDRANWFAIIFFIFSFGGMTVLQKKYGKIPWSIVLAGVGIIIGAVQDAMAWSVKLDTIKSRYGELEMSLVQIPELFTKGLDVTFSQWIHIFTGALSVAVVAVLETLISAHIADRMTKTLFNQRKEVLAIALCNMATGLAGGIPATAALARTALNIKSGATSRAAGIINGTFIVLLSTVFFGLFKYLPLPVVAAILVNVAVRMVEWPEVKLLYKMDKPMFTVAIISGLVCILEDPTMGIIAGAFLGMIRILLQMRNAHALLRVYQGTLCKFNFLFDGVDVKKSVSTCRAKFTNEPTPDEIAAEFAKTSNPVAIMDRVEAEHEIHMQRRAERALSVASKGAAGAAVFSPKAHEDGPVLHSHAHPSSHSHSQHHLGDATATELVPKVKVSKREKRAARRAAALQSGRRPSVVDGDMFHMEEDPRDAVLPPVAIYMLPGYFVYISAQAHRDRIRALLMEGALSLPGIKIVVFSLIETYFADPDALETIGILVDELHRAGYEVYMMGFHVKVLKPLTKTHWFHELRHFTEYTALLQFLRDQVNEEGVYKPAGPVTGHGDQHDAHSAPAAAKALPAAAPTRDDAVFPVLPSTSQMGTAQKRSGHGSTAGVREATSTSTHPAASSGDKRGGIGSSQTHSSGGASSAAPSSGWDTSFDTPASAPATTAGGSQAPVVDHW